MNNSNTLTNNKVEANTWKIGPQIVPPPAGASTEMRDSIAQTPQPDPATLQITPQNEAEWLAVIEQMDAGKVEDVRALQKQLAVSIEQQEIEGVNVYEVTPAERSRHEGRGEHPRRDGERVVLRAAQGEMACDIRPFRSAA